MSSCNVMKTFHTRDSRIVFHNYTHKKMFCGVVFWGFMARTASSRMGSVLVSKAENLAHVSKWFSRREYGSSWRGKEGHPRWWRRSAPVNKRHTQQPRKTFPVSKRVQTRSRRRRWGSRSQPSGCPGGRKQTWLDNRERREADSSHGHMTTTGSTWGPLVCKTPR